jgi:glycosyltransferase involved in cell wall biosynthesis
MKGRLKISLVCHDLSINSVGRAYILAKVLQEQYDIEIVGRASKSYIWEPIRNDKTIRFKIINTKRPMKAISDIDGDIIYACKAKGYSYGYALCARYIHKRPLILDIDDWDYAFFKDLTISDKIINLSKIWNLDNGFFTYLMDKQTDRADKITVSNTFLQKKFGGTLIPHFRDTDKFNPDKYNNKLKHKLGIKDKKIVLFLGTPRQHKGIDDVVRAVSLLNQPDVILLIVGANKKDQQKLPNLPYVKILGQQPFDKIPEFLSIADVIVIIQSTSDSAKGQLPAKVFDAMSMAKPVIASAVSDLPKVLNGCGIIIKPGDSEQLVSSLDYILSNTYIAHKLGKKARQRCIDMYSYKSITPKLQRVVTAVL